MGTFMLNIVRLLCVTLLIQTVAFAQTSEIITGEGISGDIDKKRRSPTVSLSTNKTEGNVQILVDAFVADTEYQKYPIQFDFYINRKFFTSQLRSTELPGAIGIDVASSVAKTPFNYSIVARTLHPNREFTTVINGAVFDTDIAAQFDCTLTTAINSEESREYIANGVNLNQVGNDALSISFETNSTPEGHSVKLSGTININDSEASSNITINEDQTTDKIVALTGESETDEEGDLISISLTSDDSDTSLSCS